MARRLHAGLRPTRAAAGKSEPVPLARIRPWPDPGPHWAARLLVGRTGDWVSTTRDCHWTRRWSSALRSYTTAHAHRAAAVELLALWLLGFIAAVRSTSNTGCGVAHATSGVVHLLLLLYAVVARPYRCAKDIVAQVLRSGLLSFGLACYAYVYFQGSDKSPVGAAAFDVASVIVVVTVPLDVVIAVLIYCTGWRRRLQKAEWGEQEEASQLMRPMPHLHTGSDHDAPASTLYTSFSVRGSFVARPPLQRGDTMGTSFSRSPRSPISELPDERAQRGRAQDAHPLLPRSPPRSPAAEGSDNSGSDDLEATAAARAPSKSIAGLPLTVSEEFTRISTTGTLPRSGSTPDPAPATGGRTKRTMTLRGLRAPVQSRLSLQAADSGTSLRAPTRTSPRRPTLVSRQQQTGSGSPPQPQDVGPPVSARDQRAPPAAAPSTTCLYERPPSAALTALLGRAPVSPLLTSSVSGAAATFSAPPLGSSDAGALGGAASAPPSLSGSASVPPAARALL
eukprot:TRINITY_DN8412_c0_g1_i3.p1 TRINITY_DN8412_c0_g1~~TRINITY_DN8412_c0_g1_i3.p1  ORF type:complete len:530 (+),score=71.35 TRINITY_DN8412_c0_g1_i3:68-1591(+)